MKIVLGSAGVILAAVISSIRAAEPIPPGFGWPTPASQLVEWTTHQNMPLVRDHAWKLGASEKLVG